MGAVIGPKFMEPVAIVVQRFVRDDGTEERFVVAGSSYDWCAGTNREWTIVRYLASGEVDTSFGPPGANGVVTKKFPKGEASLFSAAIDNSGRILVGGYLHLGTSSTTASSPGSGSMGHWIPRLRRTAWNPASGC